jgi:hypothetical protein
MKNRLALQRIYWIKPKVPIVEEIKDIDMVLNLQEDYLAETPSGKGRVFKKQEFIVPYLIPRPLEPVSKRNLTNRL